MFYLFVLCIVGLDIGFNTQLVITLNYGAIADLHTLQITTAHAIVLSLLLDAFW
jgi:hypothetical protein